MAKLDGGQVRSSRPRASLPALTRTLREIFGRSRLWKAPERALPFPAGRVTAARPIRLEPLEPRVLLSGDVNPAQTVTGAIEVPGEVDQYGFTLPQNARIVFDSLTDDANLSWSLSGPTGQLVTNRPFDSSDYGGSAASPLLDLPVGDYTLSVNGASGATGEYTFRLIDLFRAQDIVPGTAVTGQLDPANESAVYRFGATAGDRFYLDFRSLSGSNVNWRLFDTEGRSVFGPTAMSQAGETEYSAPFDGSYTLLVEGAVANTGVASYSFDVHKITDDVKPLVPGEAQGTEPQWTAGKLGGGLYLDGLQVGEVAHSASIDLTQTVTLEAWINVDRFANTWAPLIYKGSGNSGERTYALWLGADGSLRLSTGDGANQDVTTAAGLVGLDQWQHVAGVIDRASGQMRLYVDGVESAAGAVRATAASSSSNALLIGSASESDPTQAAFEGTIDDVRVWNVARTATEIAAAKDAELTGAEAGLVAYLKADDAAGDQLTDSSGHANAALIRPLYATSGLVAGRIDHPGQRDLYTFTLADSTRLYFDSLTNNANLTWTLVGPRGTVVSGLPFTGSDSSDLSGSAIYELVAGDYTLVVDAATDHTAPYAFRLLDVALATDLVPGTPESGQLASGRETRAYRVTVNPDDAFFFDYLSGGSNDVYWRLVDPFGRLVLGPRRMSDGSTYVAPASLVPAGVYTLLVEGRVTANAPIGYSFKVETGAVSPAGGQDFDASGLPYALRNDSGPAAQVLAGGPSGNFLRLAYGSAGNNKNEAAFNSVAGGAFSQVLAEFDFRITPVSGRADGMGFALLDAATYGSSGAGPSFSEEPNLANTFGLGFDIYNNGEVNNNHLSVHYNGVKLAEFGDPGFDLGNGLFNHARIVLDATTGGALLTVTLTPNGGAEVTPISGYFISGLTLKESRAAFAARTGGQTANFDIDNVAVQLAPGDPAVPVVPVAMALNNAVQGTLASAGEQQAYAFTLIGDTRVYFDALTNNPSLKWSITGARTPLSAPRSFTASDSAGGTSIFDLGAGDYVLTVGGAAASYGFRLVDLASATEIVPSAPVTGTLSAGNATDFYRFDAGAGERFFFDYQSASNGATYWRLLDPYGRAVFGPRLMSGSGGDVDVTTLAFTGTYTLLIEGRIDAGSGPVSYAFNAQRIADDASPLVFGQAQGVQDRQWTAGQFGAALYLDGTMYARVAHSTDVNPTRSATFEAWIRIDRFADNGAAPILFKGVGTGASDRSYALWVNANGSVEFSLANIVGNNYTATTGSGLIRADEWHHVAAVIDHSNPSARAIRLYVDGIERASVTGLNNFDNRAWGHLLIGRDLEAGWGNFEGTIDEVRIWDVARTQAQIVAAKDGELLGTESNLTMYLRANEATGEQLADATGRGNTGQIHNVYGAGSGVIAGRIDHPGQRDFYTFTLAEPKQLYFDSLTPSSCTSIR